MKVLVNRSIRIQEAWIAGSLEGNPLQEPDLIGMNNDFLADEAYLTSIILSRTILVKS